MLDATPRTPHEPPNASRLGQVPTCTQGFAPAVCHESCEPHVASKLLMSQGVTITAIKVTSGLHLQLTVSQRGLTPPTHTPPSSNTHTWCLPRDPLPEAGSGSGEVTRVQTAPPRRVQRSGRPSGPATGDPRRKCRLAKARDFWSLEGRKKGQPFLQPKTLPCSNIYGSPAPFQFSNSLSWIYLLFLANPSKETEAERD